MTVNARYTIWLFLVWWDKYIGKLVIITSLYKNITISNHFPD